MLIEFFTGKKVSVSATPEKPKLEKTPIEFSPTPIELMIEPIPVSTFRLVYEGDVIELPGYKWFRIVYTPGIPAITFHPTKGYSTGVFPVKFKFYVKIPELNYKGEGLYNRYFDATKDEVIEEIEYPKFTVPKVFGEKEIEIPPNQVAVPKILPKGYFVNISWEEFTLQNVFYPTFLGGDGKFHPAFVKSGNYIKLQKIEVLPAKCKPWYR